MSDGGMRNDKNRREHKNHCQVPEIIYVMSKVSKEKNKEQIKKVKGNIVIKSLKN